MAASSSTTRQSLDHAWNDPSYFSQWLSKAACQDALIQGSKNKKWEQIQSYLDCPGDESIRIEASHAVTSVFRLLLQNDPRISLILTTPTHIKVKLQRSRISNLTKISPPDFHPSADFSFFESLPSASSKSIQFFNSLEKIDYHAKLIEISKKIKQAFLSRKTNVTIPSMGYDRSFLKTVLSELYPGYLGIILTKPFDNPTNLYISLKKEPPGLEDLFSKIKTLKNDYKNKHETTPATLGSSSDPCLTSSPPILPSKRLSSDSGLSPKETADHAFDYGSAIATTYISHYIQHSSKGKIFQKNPEEEWTLIWTQFFDDPILLQKFIHETQSFLYEHLTSLSSNDKQILNRLISCDNMSSFLRTIRCLQEPVIFEFRARISGAFKMQWFREILHIPSLVSQAAKRQIQKLAILKSSIEMHRFIPLISINEEHLEKISMEQVQRSYFPDGSPSPLVSVWINHVQLDTHPPSRVIFFEQILKTLSYAMEGAEKDCSTLATLVSEGKEAPDPCDRHIAFMLRAASFSSWGYADAKIRSIVKDLPQEYHIKFINPQECPTCEFFVAKNGDFTTIRTGKYALLKDGDPQGEFIVKWKISYASGTWGSEVTIPLINLNFSCSPKEQEKIYLSFSLDE